MSKQLGRSQVQLTNLIGFTAGANFRGDAVDSKMELWVCALSLFESLQITACNKVRDNFGTCPKQPGRAAYEPFPREVPGHKHGLSS